MANVVGVCVGSGHARLKLVNALLGGFVGLSQSDCRRWWAHVWIIQGYVI